MYLALEKREPSRHTAKELDNIESTFLKSPLKPLFLHLSHLLSLNPKQSRNSLDTIQTRFCCSHAFMAASVLLRSIRRREFSSAPVSAFKTVCNFIRISLLMASFFYSIPRFCDTCRVFFSHDDAFLSWVRKWFLRCPTRNLLISLIYSDVVLCHCPACSVLCFFFLILVDRKYQAIVGIE